MTLLRITVENCRHLELIESSSYGTVLVYKLLQRLSSDIKLVISRKMSEISRDDNWNLDRLLDILKSSLALWKRALFENFRACFPYFQNSGGHVPPVLPVLTFMWFAFTAANYETAVVSSTNVMVNDR